MASLSCAIVRFLARHSSFLRAASLSCAPLAMLSGCGSVPYDTTDLVPPAKRCMTSASRLPKLKEGDDLVQAYANVSRSYGREVSKQRCLQKWAKTVLSK